MTQETTSEQQPTEIAAQKPTPDLVISGKGVSIVEYRGERVVTLRMIDELHQRPNGTAGRNFRQHREKLIEGTDYREARVDEIRRVYPDAIPYQGGETVVLLTESGYLMLVKSFQDDLAWEVQRALASNYFRVKKSMTIDDLIANPEQGLVVIGKMTKALEDSRKEMQT